MITKPMLASPMEDSKGNSQSLEDLVYPLFASIKLDGIRCIRFGGKTLSRSFKLIRNKHVQDLMKDLPNNLDGELISLNEDGSTRTFNEIQSDIMSEEGTPNFEFQIFDYIRDSLNKKFKDRLQDLQNLMPFLPSFCKLVKQEYIDNIQQLVEFEEKIINEGHEGIMVRSVNGPYKCGRATWKSQDLIKVKRFVDSEARIIGFEEKLSNQNEAEVDELGHTKRSSAKAGLVPANTLGTLLVADIHSGVEFGIGTGIGLNDELKKEIWDNQGKYLNKIVTYRFQKVGSKKDKLSRIVPRIPSFQGFRNEDDL